MREETTTIHDQTIIFDAHCVEGLPPTELFHYARYETVGECRLGRSTVHFIDHGAGRWVLREYRRGGLVSALVKSTYLYQGLDRTRMAWEFRLLAALRARRLPVPKPVAAQIIRCGVGYRGALITERLPANGTLGEALQHASLTAERWRSVGHCIRVFHNNGVYHPDLNANNIMLDSSRVYLIDFDRGKFLDPGVSTWQRANVARLRRSLNKMKRLRPVFHFEEAHWQCLLEGYAAASDNTAIRALNVAQ